MDENPAGENEPTITTHFAQVADALCDRGPIAEVARLVASGNVSAAAFGELRDRHALRREQWFRDQVPDLVLGYIAVSVKSSSLTGAHRGELQWLRRCLDIVDGEFMDRRPAELAAILGDQLDRILEDGVIDEEEELRQVELQAAFGIGYDDYLLLTRSAFERTFEELSRLAPHDQAAARKLRALEPIYRLATSRPRTLGALY